METAAEHVRRTFSPDIPIHECTHPADSAITDHGRQAGSGLSGPSVRRSPPDSTRLHKRPATGVSYFLGLQAAGQLLVTKKDLTLETILIRLARK